MPSTLLLKKSRMSEDGVSRSKPKSSRCIWRRLLFSMYRAYTAKTIEMASKTQDMPSLIFRPQDAIMVHRIERPMTFIWFFELFLLSINAHKLKIRRSLWDAVSLSPPAIKTGISIERLNLIQQRGSHPWEKGGSLRERKMEFLHERKRSGLFIRDRW